MCTCMHSMCCSGYECKSQCSRSCMLKPCHLLRQDDCGLSARRSKYLDVPQLQARRRRWQLCVAAASCLSLQVSSCIA